ncbi:hypothetical protein VM239_004529 [Salmonella enterica]|nr:hypothetical protein [Salmonella enterica]
MKLTTLLKKHFDIEEITDVDSTVNREVYTIWVYEKGEDCEPLLILKDAQDFMGVDGWLVGNIYSRSAIVPTGPDTAAATAPGKLRRYRGYYVSKRFHPYPGN